MKRENLDESVEAMKKILKALLVYCAVFCAVPVFACSQTAEKVTGGACSIKDLNNLEKNETLQVGVTPKRERDLRPVKLGQEYPKRLSDKCLLGLCIQKTLLGK